MENRIYLSLGIRGDVDKAEAEAESGLTTSIHARATSDGPPAQWWARLGRVDGPPRSDVRRGYFSMLEAGETLSRLIQSLTQCASFIDGRRAAGQEVLLVVELGTADGLALFELTTDDVRTLAGLGLRLHLRVFNLAPGPPKSPLE